MKTSKWIVVLLSASLVWGQSSRLANNDKGLVTVRGCVTKLNGDYVLIKQDPANSYQLQKTEHIKLKSYLGQRVEITGKQSETIPTSEDAINGGMGTASPVSITIQSIKRISKECRDR